jgi:hypothetical protein
MFVSAKSGLSRWAGWTVLFMSCTACSSWTVITQADPNPLPGVKAFQLQSLEFVNLKVDNKPEAEFLAKKTADQKKSWEADKAAIQRLFRQSLRERTGDAGISLGGTTAPFTLRAAISSIETGYYRMPAFMAISRVNVHVQILDASGGVVDEILLEHGVPFDVVTNPSSGGRLRMGAKWAGIYAADYLKDRTR